MSQSQEQTLAIIKPKAFKKGHAGPIITQIQQAGFLLQATKIKHLTLEEAEAFYAVHKERIFYPELCAYMASDTVMILALAKENAIADFRALIGATNPLDAAPHTLRFQFGESIDNNAIHGSDASETAVQEIVFFFGEQA